MAARVGRGSESSDDAGGVRASGEAASEIACSEGVGGAGARRTWCRWTCGAVAARTAFRGTRHARFWSRRRALMATRPRRRTVRERRSHADLKVVTVGPAGVGKTCIIYRYVHGSFNAATTPVRGSARAAAHTCTPQTRLDDTCGADQRGRMHARTRTHTHRRSRRRLRSSHGGTENWAFGHVRLPCRPASATHGHG